MRASFTPLLAEMARPMVVQQKSAPKNKETEVSKSSSVERRVQETHSVTHSTNNQPDIKGIATQTTPLSQLPVKNKVAIQSPTKKLLPK